LKKFGSRLDKADVTRIRKAAADYRDEGHRAALSNVSTIEDFLADLEAEQKDVLKQARGQGWNGFIGE
jgi:hypothetical protein